ncbi:MAG: phosphopantothenoylcysteine decarboxylase [Candidatus Omnitrophota bacterium]
MKIIVTAGPTIERIDPVRFITNRSTGYMGYSIAEGASRKGHKVTLISGPTKLKQPKVARFIKIETADELLRETKKSLKNSDCLIMCAAVGDFKVKKICKKKIKRKNKLILELIPNKDLLKELSKNKAKKIFVGFSLETEDLKNRSIKKLKDKRLDLIVANQARKERNIFGDNKLDVLIIDKKGAIERVFKKSKPHIALVLLDKIQKLWYESKLRVA